MKFYRVMAPFPRVLAHALEDHGLHVSEVGDHHVTGHGDDELDRLEDVIQDAADAAGVGAVQTTTWAMPPLARAALEEDCEERRRRPFAWARNVS